MKVKTKYGVLEDNLIVKKLLKTKPMNIGKQIRELITWTYLQNTVLSEDLDLLVSQIKQTILKAIMEAFRKEECMFCSHDGDCEKSISKFESVIKELLGENKSEVLNKQSKTR